MPSSSATLIAEAGERARREPAFVEVLAMLVDAPIHGAGKYTRQAAQALNHQRLDSVVEEFKADALVTSDVQQLLNLGTPQGVYQLSRRKKVLGLQSGNAIWFPAWQFESGRLRPDLPMILKYLTQCSTDPIAADRVMRLARDDLDGRSLIEALDDPRTARTAWMILGALGA